MTSREYPDRPLVGVGAVIIHGHGDSARVLLARRGRAPSLGEWSIPGGLVKLGEALEQAVAREVAEETGLRVKVVRLVEILDRIIYEQENSGNQQDQQAQQVERESLGKRVQYHYVIADYLCYLEPGQLPTAAIPSSDATELYWCTPRELPKFHLRPILLQILQKCLEQEK